MILLVSFPGQRTHSGLISQTVNTFPGQSKHYGPISWTEVTFLSPFLESRQIPAPFPPVDTICSSMPRRWTHSCPLFRTVDTFRFPFLNRGHVLVPFSRHQTQLSPLSQQSKHSSDLSWTVVLAGCTGALSLVRGACNNLCCKIIGKIIAIKMKNIVVAF